MVGHTRRQTSAAKRAASGAASSSTNAAGSNSRAAAKEPPRLSKTTACLPIVYGSVAYYLGKKADEFQTHQWTLFVRGPNNEDLSGVISKVVFQLHASFAQPMRELTEPPFEVTERGWGEFEAQIRIIWSEPSGEKPTLVTHGIKLYPPPPPNSPPGTVVPSDTETPVVAETYDEVVFTDPTEPLYQQLLTVSQLPPVHLKEPRVQNALASFSDNADFQALLEARKFLQTELGALQERFQVVESETTQMDQALRDMAEKSRPAARKQAAAAPPSKKAKS